MFPLAKGTTLAWLLVVFVLLTGQCGPIMQLSRVAGSIADVTEATSEVAVQATNATSHLTAWATKWMLQQATNGLTAGENVWHGADLTRLEAQRCSGQIVVAGPDTLSVWLTSADAVTLIPCLDASLTEHMLALSRSVSLAQPSTQTTRD